MRWCCLTLLLPACVPSCDPFHHDGQDFAVEQPDLARGLGADCTTLPCNVGTCCDGVCVDIYSNPEHCGGCGFRCASGQCAGDGGVPLCACNPDGGESQCPAPFMPTCDPNRRCTCGGDEKAICGPNYASACASGRCSCGNGPACSAYADHCDPSLSPPCRCGGEPTCDSAVADRCAPTQSPSCRCGNDPACVKGAQSCCSFSHTCCQNSEYCCLNGCCSHPCLFFGFCDH